MASTGKLNKLWWTLKVGVLKPFIKANGFKFRRNSWWRREGWGNINKVWVFAAEFNIMTADDENLYLTEIGEILEPFKVFYVTFGARMAELKSMLGDDVKIFQDPETKSFFVGSVDDSWLVQYRLMYGDVDTQFEEFLLTVDSRD